MNDSLTVAVIIPTYNRAAYLAESLKSIARQTRPADFVVVVDDGSTDQTGAVVDDIRREFFPGVEWPRFRYIRRGKNEGKSVAVNTALAELDTDGGPDLIWIFDDDDVADPLRLEYVVKPFEDRFDLDVVHTSAEYRDPLVTNSDGTIAPVPGNRTYWSVQDCPDEYALRWFLHGCRWFGISVIWRRSLLKRLFGSEDIPINRVAFDRWPLDPDLVRAQDYDLWIRFLAVGATSLGIDRTTVYARGHSGPRGIGHGLADPAAVDRATAKAEVRIFEKVRDNIPIETIFAGYADDPVLQDQASVEMAYAFSLRNMWADATAFIGHCQDPTVLSRVHRDACSRMLEAASGQGYDVLVADCIRIREAWDEKHATLADDPGIAAASII